MKEGKIGKAIRTLDSDAKSKVLSLKDQIGDKTVAVILANKHPKGQQINASCLVNHNKSNRFPFYNSIFEKSDDSAIEKVAH